MAGVNKTNRKASGRTRGAKGRFTGKKPNGARKRRGRR
jgi:hypothetical protein